MNPNYQIDFFESNRMESEIRKLRSSVKRIKEAFLLEVSDAVKLAVKRIKTDKGITQKISESSRTIDSSFRNLRPRKTNQLLRKWSLYGSFTSRRKIKSDSKSGYRKKFVSSSPSPFQKKPICDICNEEFENIISFKLHNRRLHRIRKAMSEEQRQRKNQKRRKVYNCNDCSEVFNHIRVFEAHKRTHFGNDTVEKTVFWCPQCGNEFKSTFALYVHQSFYTSADGFKCRVCNEVFDNVNSLTLHHYKFHRLPRDEKAIQMLESSSANSVKRVRRVSYKCEQCSQVFHNLKVLNAHILGHLQDLSEKEHLSFTCPLCDGEYKSIREIISDLISHSDSSNFKCTKCEEDFENINLLISHNHKMHFEGPVAISKYIEKEVEAKIRQRRKPSARCSDCGKRFRNPEELEAHLSNCQSSEEHEQRIQKHPPRTSFCCIVCNEDFDSIFALNGHFHHHTGSELAAAKERQKLENSFGEKSENYDVNKYTTHECEACSEICFSITKYRKHVMEVHRENADLTKKICFVCSFCEFPFFKKQNLFTHLKNLHHVFMQCPICYLFFGTKDLFIQHAEENHSECVTKDGRFVKFPDINVCKTCGVIREKYKDILAHYIDNHVHVGTLFKCKLCPKEFRCQKTLRNHNRHSHKPKTTFCCEECGKQFNDKARFKVHQKSHSGTVSTSAIECTVCGKTFATGARYNVHYKAVHTTERPYKCSVCGKSFAFQSNLHIHKVTICEKEKAKKSTCNICDKTFDNFLDLSYHKVNIHKYGNKEENVCHLCNKTTTNPLALYSHNNYYHNIGTRKQFNLNCSVCGKSYLNKIALFDHWLKHREEKPYECALCSKRFKYRSVFYSHRKVTHRNETVKVELVTDIEMLKRMKLDFRNAHKILPTKNAKLNDVDNPVENPLTNLQISYLSEGTSYPSDLTNLFNNSDMISAIRTTEIEDVVASNDFNTLLPISGDYKSKAYIDFSRANIPEHSLSAQIHFEEGEISEDLCTGKKNPINEYSVESCLENTTGDVESSIETEKLYDCEDSPMSIYHDVDLKPVVGAKKMFSEDPFPKQLVILLTKLTEYVCPDCSYVCHTLELLKKHENSRTHKSNLRKRHRKEGSMLTESVPGHKTQPKISRSSKTYNCSVCKETFIGNVLYKKHVQEHKGKKILKCALCEETFTTKKNLSDHYQEKHCGVMPFQCEKCPEGFLTALQRKRHLKLSHKEPEGESGKKLFVCEYCNDEFISESVLAKHLKIVHQERTLFCCGICSKTYSQASGLKTHMHKHTGEMPYCCDICTERFISSTMVTRHKEKVHDQPKKKSARAEEKHVCNICAKEFKHSKYLIIHQRLHTGERPFTCTFCNEAFISRKRLTAHVSSVHENKRHLCDSCGKEFKQSTDLIIHKRIIHTGEKPYSCSHCNMTFASAKRRRVHIQGDHLGKRFVCEDCGREFKRTTELIVHRRIHTGERPYACKQCDNTFASHGNLIKHIRVRHEKLVVQEKGSAPIPYLICCVCSQQFRFKKSFDKHMGLHDSNRPFPCHLCPCYFNHRSNLDLHRKNVHDKLGISYPKKKSVKCVEN